MTTPEDRPRRRERHRKIAQARNVLGEVISQARYADESTVLINRGKPAAVIVPPDFYRRALEALGEEAEVIDDDGAAAP